MQRSGCGKVTSKRKRSQLEENRENDDSVETDKKRLRHGSSSSSSYTPPTPFSPMNQNRILTEYKYNSIEPSTSKTNIMAKHNWLTKSGLMSLLVGDTVPYEIEDTPVVNYFAQHPNLQPRMRSVLLDWLIEVSEVYTLERETFYLAVNYIDRYLSKTKNILKTNLQLIGITCLFIASKVEEIYPPKLDRFAYVTDEACSCEDIIKQEMAILSKLDWQISTMTVNSWLNLLLQLCNNQNASAKAIIYPNHPVKDYMTSAQLADLALMDDGCLRFSYQTLATTAIYLATDFKEIVNVPILEKGKCNIIECLAWMSHFQDAIKDKCSSRKGYGSLESRYTIQTHHVDVALLEYAQKKLQQWQLSSAFELTPPPSNEKL